MTLTNETLHKLNGVYDIHTKDSSDMTLDLALTLKKHYWFDWATPHSIAITAIDANHIKAEVFKDDDLVSTKIIKGKIVNGYFEFTKRKILKFYLLINSFGALRTRLGLLESGELIVDSHTFTFATFVVIGLAGERIEKYDLKFPKRQAIR